MEILNELMFRCNSIGYVFLAGLIGCIREKFSFRIYLTGIWRCLEMAFLGKSSTRRLSGTKYGAMR